MTTDQAREGFEAWAVPRGYDVSGYEEPDTYPDMDTYRVAKAWHAGCEWQAALASAGQHQAVLPEDVANLVAKLNSKGVNQYKESITKWVEGSDGEMHTFRQCIPIGFVADADCQDAARILTQQQARVAELDGECERLRGAILALADKMNGQQDEPTTAFWLDGKILQNNDGHDRFISTQAVSNMLRRYAAEARAALARQAGG